MIANRESLLPPSLGPIKPVLERIPSSLHPWIAEKHIQYLDDRIHKIDRLTDYLANCQQVEHERNEFLSFVLGWTKQENPNLGQYLQEYKSRFSEVRTEVEKLCIEFLNCASKVSLDSHFLDFWRKYARINEIDSIHGMFLTSGRWYVNVMLPPVKELIYCMLGSYAPLNPTAHNDLACQVARRVITPRFSEVPSNYDHSYERRFATLFMPVLQHFDRKLCFLFEMFAQIPDLQFTSIAEIAVDVATKPEKYEILLNQGIYPPFGWHEIAASRKARRPSKPLVEASKALFQAIPSNLHERAWVAIDCLDILKEYELNYNNYNYKGRFGLISKYQYWVTYGLLPKSSKDVFLDAILLDRFFDALTILEHSKNTKN